MLPSQNNNMVIAEVELDDAQQRTSEATKVIETNESMVQIKENPSICSQPSEMKES